MRQAEAVRLGNAIRAARHRRELTQAALAAKARLTREYVARLELGQQEPSLATLRRIARALAVEAADLLR